MKKVLDSLKIQVKHSQQTAKITWNQLDVNLENDIEDLKEILRSIKNKTLRFKSNDGCNDDIPRQQLTSYEDAQKDVPKKRGRKPKTSSVSSEPKDRSDSCESNLNDSSASTSSSRSRRAAAQAAEHKMAHVQSLVQLKTKLRRPTNFDERQSKIVSSPPAKCRRTRRNQSAGSSSPHTDEGNGTVDTETNKKVDVIDNENLDYKCLNTECSVFVEKLNTPTITAFTNPKSRSSRSLDRAFERKSKDLFNNSGSLSEVNNKHAAQVAPNSDPSHKTIRKKSILKKDLDSGISSTEEELQQLIKGNLQIAHSSPILLEPFDGEFKGFDDEIKDNKAERRENTFVVEKTQISLKKTLNSENQEIMNEKITETNIIKSRTKVLKKRATHTVLSVEEKENVNRNNETHIISNESDSPSNLRSRSKVLKKAEDNIVNKTESDENNSEDLESQSSPEMNVRSRTKTIRKHDEHNQELKSESEIVVRSVRSRTKTIKKNIEKEDQSDSTDDESGRIKSRTKTIRKGTANVQPDVADGLGSEYLISEFKDNNLPSNKTNARFPPLSPAPAKGDLVKKRVKDFEKMQNGSEEEEEKTVGRVTRNAVKIKATEAQSSKQARTMMQLAAPLKKTNKKPVDKGKRDKLKEEKENMPVAKLQASAVKQPLSTERSRMTPLGVNNRMTPASDNTLKAQANKWTNSANRPVPVETNNTALIHKQAAEEAERKRKEEEVLKRKAKEEDAKRKKEKVLKATAEEARRKRMEKLQKVAATREAAEKEKERLAAKAEKEKEERMRQIAIDKDKLKEEQIKKKQLTQQKNLEHEERRKQEEAARLARLKEQEEEHRRLLAMKEREQELQKQQKGELRIAETDKTKHHGGKLGKIAVVNNAKQKMQGATSSDKSNAAQSSDCYVITPAREERPLLPPKTENDYGIDDAHSEDSSEDESQPKKVIPAWAQAKNRERLLMVNKYMPKKLWEMFMECDPCPDINKMFAGNPIKRRIRTSSAVWRTPPKYSRIAS